MYLTTVSYNLSIGDMTTTSAEGKVDGSLTYALQANQTEFHILAPLTDQLSTKEAQCHGGPLLIQQLNAKGTSDIVLDLQCNKDEAILMGSIHFKGEARIVGVIAATGARFNWQSNANGTAATYFNTANDNSDTKAYTVPALFANSQFNQLDMEIGPTQSVNSLLPLTMGSEGGNGAQALMSAYFNEPADGGFYKPNCTSAFGATHRHNMALNGHEQTFEFFEKVHHQTNVVYNCLCSRDFDDTDCRKIWPRGCSIKIRATTRPYGQRLLLYVSHNGERRLELEFLEVKVLYTTVRIPDLTEDDRHRELEPMHSIMATMDVSVRTVGLTADQRFVTVQITHSDSQFVPQWVICFVANQNCFDVVGLNPAGVPGIASVPDAILRGRVNLNGDNSPDFMRVFQDNTIDLRDLWQKMVMMNAFLGKAGALPGKSTAEHTPAEKCILSHPLGNQATALADNCLIICTDPSSTLIQECASSVLQGRLEINIDLGPGITAQHRMVVCCFAKQQICVQKTQEWPGSSPQYQICREHTVPAYTTVFQDEQAMASASTSSM